MNRSILVVDDEPATRYLMRLLLENLGYLVYEANFGLDALQQLRNNRPDLMIFDVKQENSSGFAVCQANSPTALTNLPIVLLTAKTHWAVFSEILHDTFMHYIPKPITSKGLNDLFSTLLEGSPTAVAPTTD